MMISLDDRPMRISCDVNIVHGALVLRCWCSGISVLARYPASLLISYVAGKVHSCFGPRNELASLRKPKVTGRDFARPPPEFPIGTSLHLSSTKSTELTLRVTLKVIAAARVALDVGCLSKGTVHATGATLVSQNLADAAIPIAAEKQEEVPPLFPARQLTVWATQLHPSCTSHAIIGVSTSSRCL